MTTKVMLSSCVLIAALLLTTMMLRAQDPVKVAHEAFKERLSNNNVRVLEYQSKPGDKEAMHEHARSVLYVISGGKIRFTDPDGKTKDVEYKTGDVLWRDPVKHSGENIGTTELHVILVEMKEPKKK